MQNECLNQDAKNTDILGQVLTMVYQLENHLQL